MPLRAPLRRKRPSNNDEDYDHDRSKLERWDLPSAPKMDRRHFEKYRTGHGSAGRGGLTSQSAQAFAYEPYPRDNDLQTVVTSCAHNCGSRHMLVAHKKGDDCAPVHR
ncbi:MAG: hypothetical protein R3E89_14540 [Thiolinea sp.]